MSLSDRQQMEDLKYGLEEESELNSEQHQYLVDYIDWLLERNPEQPRGLSPREEEQAWSYLKSMLDQNKPEPQFRRKTSQTKWGRR